MTPIISSFKASLVAFPVFKGLVIATVAFAITNDFLDALIVAVTSGVLGIIGMVLSAWISTRQYHKNIEPDLTDVKKKVGADKREHDQ